MKFASRGLSISKGCGLLIILTTLGIGTAQSAPNFAEPGSGRKVSSYDVTLPVTRDKKQIFSIPADCDTAVENAWRSGAQQWGGRVSHSIWWKVRRDCDFYEFLGNSAIRVQHDYVSDYDFMNARLSDLPTLLRCGQQGVARPECSQLPENFPDFSTFLPIEITPDNNASTANKPCKACRVRNGIYRGKVIKIGEQVHCQADPSAPGFRIIAIDFADVNSDGYQDVILRLFPLGIGRRKAPLILPLTRYESTGPFSVPTNITLPSAKRR